MRIKRKKTWSVWNSGRHSLGIELTDQHIKLIELSVQGKVVQVHHQDKEKLAPGLVEEGRILDLPKLVVLLQQMLARLNVKTKTVHAVLPSPLVMVRYLKLPDLPDKQLRKVVDFELKHNLHLPFDEPLYDFLKQNGSDEPKARLKPKQGEKRKKTPKTKATPKEEAFLEAAASEAGANSLFAGFDEPKPDGGELENPLCDVLLVAAPKDLVDEYQSLFEAAGLQLKSLEVKAFSLYRLIEASDAPGLDGTFLLLDVNATVSDLTIYHQKQLKITRSLPIVFGDKSPSAFEPAPVDDFLFLPPAAPHADVAFEAALNELGHELERMMNFYRYSMDNRNQVFDRLVLSGDIDRMGEIAVYLQERLNLKVESVRADRFRSTGDFAASLPQLAVPTGLALRGRNE